MCGAREEGGGVISLSLQRAYLVILESQFVVLIVC